MTTPFIQQAVKEFEEEFKDIFPKNSYWTRTITEGDTRDIKAFFSAKLNQLLDEVEKGVRKEELVLLDLKKNDRLDKLSPMNADEKSGYILGVDDLSCQIITHLKKLR